MKSGPTSSDRKREDRSDSSSSKWKLGVVRYRVVSERVPIGCGTAGNTWVSFDNGNELMAGGVSGNSVCQSVSWSLSSMDQAR